MRNRLLYPLLISLIGTLAAYAKDLTPSSSMADWGNAAHDKKVAISVAFARKLNGDAVGKHINAVTSAKLFLCLDAYASGDDGGQVSKQQSDAVNAMSTLSQIAVLCFVSSKN